MKSVFMLLLVSVCLMSVKGNQATTLKLQVLDEHQESLAGVKVEVMGLNNAVFYTNLKGECILPMAAQNHLISIQSISYKPLTIPAHAKISKIILHNR